jgi:CBS domain-containing protein
MTKTVAVVAPRAPFKTIVDVMCENRVSAVPVVDGNGELVGIVTEDDLLARQAGLADGVHLLERHRRGRHAPEGLYADDLMTTPVVTVRPEATLAEAARRMHERHVKRLPVVDASGRLVGIVSRADLLRVVRRSDAAIERDVREEVLGRQFMDQAAGITATVHEGVVRLDGTLEHRSEMAVLLDLVDATDGVIGIDNRLTAGADGEVDPAYEGGAMGALGYPFVPPHRRPRFPDSRARLSF